MKRGPFIWFPEFFRFITSKISPTMITSTHLTE